MAHRSATAALVVASVLATACVPPSGGAPAGSATPDRTSPDPTSPDPTSPLPAAGPFGPTVRPGGEGGADAPAHVLALGRRRSDPSVLVAAAVTVAARGAAPAARLHVEAVEQLDPTAAVVVVVLLSRDVGGDVRTQRLAVPVVHTAAGPRAGTPWPLPPASVAEVPVADLLPHLPVDDPRLVAQARLALAAAGWRDVVVEQVSLAVDAWPHVVRFRGATAGGVVEERTVWLRRHLGDLVVAGLPVPGADEPDRGGQDDR